MSCGRTHAKHHKFAPRKRYGTLPFTRSPKRFRQLFLNEMKRSNNPLRAVEAASIDWQTYENWMATALWSVFHRLNLVHHKHSHEQYVVQQRDLMQLELERHNLALPHSTTIHQQNNILSNQPMARLGQVRTEDMDTNVLTDVLDEDAIVAPQLSREELILYRNERQQPGQKLNDLQLCQPLGYKQNASGQRRVRRLRERMRQEHKL